MDDYPARIDKLYRKMMVIRKERNMLEKNTMARMKTLQIQIEELEKACNMFLGMAVSACMLQETSKTREEVREELIIGLNLPKGIRRK